MVQGSSLFAPTVHFPELGGRTHTAAPGNHGGTPAKVETTKVP